MIFGFQDTAPINGNLRMLAVYHALGVRVIQLTYNDENAVGCGCMAPEDKGLTSFGREVVAEMNRLGILVDLSHCGHRTTMDAIEASKGPVAFTHANPLAWPKARETKRMRRSASCGKGRGGGRGASSIVADPTRERRAWRTISTPSIIWSASWGSITWDLVRTSWKKSLRKSWRP
jgi:hypothetical protein